MPPEHLLSARKVADRFGCCLKTLHNWEKDQILVPVRLRRRRYYRAADVEALLTGAEPPTTASSTDCDPKQCDTPFE